MGVRGMLRLFGVGAGIALLTALCAEALLALGALGVRDRAGGWRPGAAVHVLSVGDSHTYGAGVEAEESYPAQLQAALDERAPEHFSVINLGIPGLSTTQVRNRLPDQVSRYRPEVVVVWSGINNAWNRAEVEGAAWGWRGRLDAAAQRSRLYRLARVWWRDRRLDRSTEATRAGGLPQQAERRVDLAAREEQSFEEEDGRVVTYAGEPKVATWVVRHDGVEERIENRHGPRRFDTEMERRAADDYRAMAAWLRRAGVRLILVLYPLEVGGFERANAAMRRVGEEEGIAVVASSSALERVPPDARLWLPGSHPGAAIYAEIARDLAALLLAEDPGRR